MSLSKLVKHLFVKQDSLEHVDPSLAMTDGIPIQHVDNTPPPTIEVEIAFDRKPDALDQLVTDHFKLSGEKHG